MIEDMDSRLRRAAQEAIGFMPEVEGEALYEAGLSGAERAPLLEVGSYCGKSTIYLGAAARAKGTVMYSIDHHRGSEEHQMGEEFHDPRLVDSRTGEIDTLPTFRRTISEAGLDDVVIGIVGRSEAVASRWGTPLGLVLIDGSHSEESARRDYEGWATHLVTGGLLAIHDVFEDPARGGQAPLGIYLRALRSGVFVDKSSVQSLRVLLRIGDDPLF
jgi:predicted O-methyltransferase YrrM